MAAELKLDVNHDIMVKMNLRWPPSKADAEKILRRLNEKKQEAAPRV